MSHDQSSGQSNEGLKAKWLETMARRFHITGEDAEDIYRQMMKDPTPPHRASVPTWTTEHPTQIGLYWYRRHAADKPFIVEVWKLKSGLLTVADLDQGTKCASWDGQWAGPLEPPS